MLTYVLCKLIKLLYFKIYNCFRGSSHLLLLGATRLDISQNDTLSLESVTSIIHSQYDGDTANNDIAVIQLPSAITFNCKYCHILMNIKIIFLIYEPHRCYLHCLQHRSWFFCDLFCMERFCSIFNTHYSVAMSSLCSNYCYYNKGCTYIMWEAELCLHPEPQDPQLYLLTCNIVSKYYLFCKIRIFDSVRNIKCDEMRKTRNGC